MFEVKLKPFHKSYKLHLYPLSNKKMKIAKKFRGPVPRTSGNKTPGEALGADQEVVLTSVSTVTRKKGWGCR